MRSPELWSDFTKTSTLRAEQRQVTLEPVTLSAMPKYEDNLTWEPPRSKEEIINLI
jgi:hypothetical protein